MYQVGGTLGAILVGRLMDRFDPHRVLFAGYLAGAACIVLHQPVDCDSRWLMTLAVFAAGPAFQAARLAATRSRRRSTRRRTARPAWLGQRRRPQRLDCGIAPRRRHARLRVAGDDGLCAGRDSCSHLGPGAGDTRARAPARGDRPVRDSAMTASGTFSYWRRVQFAETDVFVSSGYASLGFMPGNVLLAYSVDGQ